MGSTTVALPDLDTENTDVQSMISDWIKSTVLAPTDTADNRLKRMELMDFVLTLRNLSPMLTRKW